MTTTTAMMTMKTNGKKPKSTIVIGMKNILFVLIIGLDVVVNSAHNLWHVWVFVNPWSIKWRQLIYFNVLWTVNINMHGLILFDGIYVYCVVLASQPCRLFFIKDIQRLILRFAATETHINLREPRPRIWSTSTNWNQNRFEPVQRLEEIFYTLVSGVVCVS